MPAALAVPHHCSEALPGASSVRGSLSPCGNMSPVLVPSATRATAFPLLRPFHPKETNVCKFICLVWSICLPRGVEGGSDILYRSFFMTGHFSQGCETIKSTHTGNFYGGFLTHYTIQLPNKKHRNLVIL